MKEFIVGHVKLLSFIAGGVAAAGVVTGIIIYNNNHLTVTYTLDGKEYEVTENIKKGSILKEPETPTKEGYTFDGWYVDGEKFDFDTEIKGKLELEARFTINKYTITFENSFAESTTETVEWNKKVNKPENPSAYGYTFTGWYLNNELYNFDTPVTGDLTLIAGWYADSVSYTVNHYLLDEEGKSDKVETTVNGTGYVGYTVKAETKDYKGYIKPEEKTMILGYNANVVNYYYPLGEYKVTLEGDNGIESTEGAGTYRYGDIVELSYELAPGYEFNKYSVEVEDNKYTVEDKDVTIELTTTPIEYKITLNNVEEATFAKENPTTYTIEDEKITLVNPTMDGYTFTGWATSEEATSGSMEVVINPSALKDVTYYATWVVLDPDYTITYTLNGGSISIANPTSYKETSETFTINNPTKTGYEFAGWKTNENDTATTTYTVTSGSKGDLTLIATWTPITYTITYDYNGGTAPTTENLGEYNIESETFTINNPTKTGYYFAGWSDGTNPTTTSYKITKGSIGDKTLTAVWSQYKITLNTNNGKDPIELYANNDTTWSSLNISNPTKEGYTFAGWYTDSNFTNSYTIPTEGNVSESVTLYAKWNAISYTISYTLFGGTVSTANPTSYTIESETFTLYNPTKDGFKFIGWYDGNKISTEYKIKNGTIGNIEVAAMWEKAYEVTLMDGETSINTVLVVNGETWNLSEPTKTGHTFVGWYKDAEFTNKFNETIVNLTDNLTLYAKFDDDNVPV